MANYVFTYTLSTVRLFLGISTFDQLIQSEALLFLQQRAEALEDL